MQGTPRSLRPHIGIFGRRNVGKSSLINALVGQEVAIVSDVPGTTTDPVFKPIELLPFGPVVLIDTAGLDDEGFLGELRKKKSLEILNRCDVALLVWDGKNRLYFRAGNSEAPPGTKCACPRCGEQNRRNPSTP